MKMKRIAILLAANAGLMVTAAFASAETAPKSEDTRRICRDSGRELGSHIRAGATLPEESTTGATL